MKILKNLKKNTILLLIITLIVLYIILKDDFYDIINILQNLDIKFILLAILFFFLSVAIKGYVNYKIINDKEKISLKEAIKHNLITQFFNGITPFSTGGQPMEIYMLTEHNISVSKATNQTIQSFIFYQIALVICGALAVIYNFIFHLFPKITILRHLVQLGFIINIAVVIVLIIISYSKVITKKIGNIIIKILKKLRIKTDEKKIEKVFDEYYEGFQEIKSRRGLFPMGIILNIASLLCLYIVPLFILYSMRDFMSISAVETVTASAYVYIIGAFVPVPGASGGIEYGFTQIFGNFIYSNKLSATLLLWRFITYFVGMITGAIVFNTEKKEKK